MIASNRFLVALGSFFLTAALAQTSYAAPGDVRTFSLGIDAYSYIAKIQIPQGIGSPPAGGIYGGTISAALLAAEARLTNLSFNDNPPKGTSRIHTSAGLQFKCVEGDDAHPLAGAANAGASGGYDGPFQATTKVDFVRLTPAGYEPPPDNRPIGPFTLRFQIQGHPARVTSAPIFDTVAFRALDDIWHDVTIKFYCKGGKGYWTGLNVQQSNFPSLKVFVNGALQYQHKQGPFSDLFNLSTPPN